MRLSTRLLVPALAVVVGASTASAQATSAAAAAPAPTANRNMISVNPLGLMWGLVSGEYEHQMGTKTSFALAGSLYSPELFTYTSAEVKGKFLPSEQGLAGFAIGPTLGFTRVADKDVAAGCVDCVTSANAVTAGMELGYTWLLGAQNSFAIGTALGAKRLFFMGDQLDGVSGTIPTVKLTVGWAF